MAKANPKTKQGFDFSGLPPAGGGGYDFSGLPDPNAAAPAAKGKPEQPQQAQPRNPLLLSVEDVKLEPEPAQKWATAVEKTKEVGQSYDPILGPLSILRATDTEPVKVLSDYVQTIYEGARDKSKEGSFNWHLFNWAAEDLPNVMRIASPQILQDFVTEAVKDPLEALKEMKDFLRPVIKEGDKWVINPELKRTPLTHYFAYSGLLHAGKGVAKKGLGLEPLFTVKGKPVYLGKGKTPPVEPKGPPVEGIDLFDEAATPPAPVADMFISETPPAGVGVAERIPPPEPLFTKPKNAYPDYRPEFEVEMQRTVEGPSIYSARPALPQPERVIETPFPSESTMHLYPTIGETPPAKMLPPETFISDWSQSGMVATDLFTKPLIALDTWYRKMPVEARQEWWKEHIEKPFYMPMNPKIYETGIKIGPGKPLKISYDNYVRLEKARQYFMAGGENNRIRMEALYNVNPELAWKIYIEPRKIMADIETQTQFFGRAMKGVPIEIREAFTDFNEGRITGQQFVDFAGDKFPKIAKDWTGYLLDKIAYRSGELKKMGYIAPEELSTVQEKTYLHRTQKRDLTLPEMRDQISGVYGPGTGEAVESLFQKNLVPELDGLYKLRVENPGAYAQKMKGYDYPTQQTLKFVMDKGLTEIANNAESMIKDSNRFLKKFNKSLRLPKIDKGILKARGIEKPVGIKNVSKWEEAGWRKKQTYDPEDNLVDKVTPDGKQVMWRDYTHEERKAMGEIKAIDYKITDTAARQGGSYAKMKVLEMIGNPENNIAIDSLKAAESGLANLRSKINRFEKVGSRAPEELYLKEKMLSEQWDKTNARIMESKRVSGEWVEVPDNPKAYGPVAGKMVPKPYWEMIKEGPGSVNNNIGAIANKMVRSFYRRWKKSKTVWNPGTHIRNIMFNFILADMGGVGPFDPGNAKYYKYAWNELKKERANPGSSEFVAKIKEVHPDIIKTGNIAEMDQFIYEMGRRKNLFDESPANALYDTVESLWDKTAGRADKFASYWYGMEEVYFKAVIIAKEVSKGKSYEQAVAKAQKYLFDYSNVSPFVDLLRNTPLIGSPFVTFKSKLLPLVIETMATNPTVFVKYLILQKMIDAASDHMYGRSREESNDINAARPSWMQNPELFGITIPTKTMSTPLGRMPIINQLLGLDPEESYNYDISYINPSADFAEIISTLSPAFNDPVFNEMISQFTGEEALTHQPWLHEGWPAEPLSRTEHAATNLAPLPSWLMGGKQAGGKLYRAGEQMLTGSTSPDYYGQVRSPQLLILDALAAQKIRPELALKMAKQSTGYENWKINDLNKEINKIKTDRGKTWHKTNGDLTINARKKIAYINMEIKWRKKNRDMVKATLRSLQSYGPGPEQR